MCWIRNLGVTRFDVLNNKKHKTSEELITVSLQICVNTRSGLIISSVHQYVNLHIIIYNLYICQSLFTSVPVQAWFDIFVFGVTDFFKRLKVKSVTRFTCNKNVKAVTSYYWSIFYDWYNSDMLNNSCKRVITYWWFKFISLKRKHWKV